MKSTCCNADAILRDGCLPKCSKCGFPFDQNGVFGFGVNNLIGAYKLGYADRNAKMPPFGDMDPKEYILSLLKNM